MTSLLTDSPRDPARWRFTNGSCLLFAVAFHTLACGPAALVPEQTGIAVPLTASFAPPEQPLGGAQQAIVERAADAVSRLTARPKFSAVARLLEKARAVAIFPELSKTSLVFGGEGGNGVVVAKGYDDSWSYPAFYALGAPSAGLQTGVQSTTLLLFIMDEKTVERMLYSSLTLGANTSATLGHVGERGLTETELRSKNIFELAEAGGAFAGVSFDGYVITARQEHNSAYYGAGATPESILFDRSSRRPEALVLLRALSSGAAAQISP